MRNTGCEQDANHSAGLICLSSEILFSRLFSILMLQSNLSRLCLTIRFLILPILVPNICPNVRYCEGYHNAALVTNFIHLFQKILAKSVRPRQMSMLRIGIERPPKNRSCRELFEVGTGFARSFSNPLNYQLF